MAEKRPQNYKNHGRLDPPYHYFVVPVIALSLLGTIWNVVRHPGIVSLWLVVATVAVAILAFKARLYALKAQDRIIRLEERLRLHQVLPATLKTRIPELREGQLIALRFASDEEVADLVERALAEKLSTDQIKRAVGSWRPDYFRV